MRAKAWMKTADSAAIDHVAGEREVGAGAGGGAVDGGDGRDRAVVDRAQHRLVFLAQRALEVEVGGASPRSWPEQKARAGAGQHEDARLRRASATAAAISRRMAAFSPFITSGRFRVMVATSSVDAEIVS